MKRILIIGISLLLSAQYLFAQEKILADLKIINFLGKVPYKTERNSLAESLLSILYFNPQPKNYPKIGFLDNKGALKIKPIYSMASDFYDGYANIIKDTTYGYIDKNGAEVLFSQYQQTYFYYGDVGVAKKDGKYGLIDRKGKPITDFKYNMINYFGFNHFQAVPSNGKSYLLNKKGEILFNKDFAYNIRSHFFEKDSLIIIEKASGNKPLQGLITLGNKTVVAPYYDNIYFIGDDELILVQKDKKYGFINKLGKEVIPLIYDEGAFQITENLLCVKQNNKWGYINRKNETIIPFEYDEAYPFFSGKAFVKKDNLYGVIGTNNKIKVEFSLEKSEYPFYSDNLSPYKKEGKYGYIDKNGKVAIPAIYSFAYPFVSKLAYVELNGKAGFIDGKGKEVIPIKYKQMWLPSDGLIRFAE